MSLRREGRPAIRAWGDRSLSEGQRSTGKRARQITGIATVCYLVLLDVTVVIVLPILRMKTPEKDFPGIRVYSRTRHANRAMKKVSVLEAVFLAPLAMSCAAQKPQTFTAEIDKTDSPQRRLGGPLDDCRSGFREMGF
jgi:hypothetical protein